MYAHINELEGKEISPGVVERVLMNPYNDIRPGFGARHYTLTNG